MENIQRVRIDIHGGVADVVHKDVGIELEIFDWDNEKESKGTGKAIYDADDLIEDAISEKALQKEDINKEAQEKCDRGVGEMSKIEKAKAKLKAATLRILAVSQRSNAGAYRRQAMTPTYPGQEIIFSFAIVIYTSS